MGVGWGWCRLVEVVFCLWKNSAKFSGKVLFEVLDSNGNLLFTESNDNLGSFISLEDKTMQVSEDYAKRLGLSTFEEWSKWLIAEKKNFDYKDGNYKWILAESQEIPGKAIGENHRHPLEEYSHLGVGFVVRSVSTEHKICGKKWSEVKIFNKKSKECIAVCGYIL